jgi:hypothetical protein
VGLPLLLLLKMWIILGLLHRPKIPCWVQPSVQGEGAILSLAAPMQW